MNPGTRPPRILGSKLPGSPARPATPAPAAGAVRAAARRRATLAAFLRSRRERLLPDAAGVPAFGRRRTPGLRREEVAQLAGVSVAWYTWLEQGREIHPSADALDAIARALQLGAEERLHAFALAGREPPGGDLAPPPVAAPAQVHAVLDAIAFPAYAADRVGNVLAWNAIADAIFGYAARAPADRNSLVIAFTDPAFRAMVVNWADEAGHLVANFRRVADEAPDDPAVAALVDRLRATPEFRRLWARHEVRRRHFVHKELRHPRLGTLVFGTQSYHSAPLGLRLVIFVPDAATATRLARATRALAKARTTRTVGRGARRHSPAISSSSLA